ncbi:ABC transporter permease [Streptomyces acidiscabies]|uniref:ABC transporter permease n=1 Tax=Streptomyces acidiscabies TaxID=42234 RepID=A0A0L0JD04_9ACTN|nr:ABC transporter permease [Streptomyces acidiscabies]MBP5942274.1 ABC transporter permease [Streptomyces sp. LBUM 1476]KND23602.1 membrane protein [Streptomyces acidiscabies]MBZ3913807.1 ABC transporter permease [Streptomyces acidiscabies]MDX2965282.1 ABC transporter permease [Streptomyces acidiscabies]MDX3022102.1 ABC transporter permease [Streptomyces acidiscabies]
MSTLTATVEAPSAGPARPAYRVTGRRVLASEWAKLWSLRSTWITLGVGLLFVVAFGLIAASRYKSGVDSGHLDGDFADSTAVSLSLFGTDFAQLALGVLGVLVTAGEYSTGMIRSTLAAVPRRLPVLWSKAAVFGLVALAVGTLGAFVAFGFGSGIVSGTPAAMGLAHAGVVRSLLGAGLYLGLVGVIGIALGALLRSVAGGISVLVASLMLVPGLISLLPSSWRDDIRPYLPSEAGASMFALTHDSTALSPTAGLLVLLGWTALALTGAAYRLVRSDV